jgi:DNA anti-recombination protein RmuC
MLRSLIKLLPCALLFALAPCGHARAQQPPPPTIKPRQSQPSILPSAHDPIEGEQAAPVTEEMLKDAEIRRQELTRKENLQRARETAQLGAELRDAFERQKSLGAAEMKKVGRIEKLARAIRNEAGGDNDDEGLKDPPARLETALSRLSEMCEELRKKVEKTPRHVVSAAVITSANQLIELAKYIRTLGG